jgi:hypothetical protein
MSCSSLSSKNAIMKYMAAGCSVRMQGSITTCLLALAMYYYHSVLRLSILSKAGGDTVMCELSKSTTNTIGVCVCFASKNFGTPHVCVLGDWEKLIFNDKIPNMVTKRNCRLSYVVSRVVCSLRSTEVRSNLLMSSPWPETQPCSEYF